MSENVQISYRSEAGYGAGNEHVAIANSTIPSVSDDSTQNMDTIVSDVVDKSDGSNLHVSEHEEVHTTPIISRHELQTKRRQVGTVFWEPLLVPSEVDGKVEMVTALKRVDSNYISSPRANPKLATAQIVKESKFSGSPRLEMRQSSPYIKPSTKVIVSKSTTDPEIKHFIKKKAPDIKISEQMGKAIAEKEAAILKEIEKAMKEANIRTKSVLSDKSMPVKNKSSEHSEQSKSKISLKVVPTQNVRKEEVVEVHDFVSVEPDIPLDSSELIDDVVDSERDGTKLIQSSPKPVSDAARILSVSTSKTILSPAEGSVTKEMHGLSKVSAVPGKVAASSSLIRPVTKEMQSVNKILKVPGTVMVTSPSTVVTVPKEVQAMNQVLCGPTTVFTSPKSTAVISARDGHAVNQVIAVPRNTKSNPQTLTETPGPRILLLAAPPGGSLPLLTPIIPATSIPVIHAPGTSTLGEKPDLTRVAENRAKRGKDLNSVTPGMSSQFVGTESMNVEGSGTLNILGRRHSVKKTYDRSRRNITVTQESVSDNIKMSSLSLQNMHFSVDAQKSVKPSATQSSLFLVAKGVKNSPVQRGDKSTLTIPVNKSGSADLQKQETAKTNTASNVAVSVKATPCTQQNLLQKSVKDPQKMDCNGESMDIDDESISEELDQGFVDDTRNVTGQNLLSGEAKDSTYAGGNTHHSREQSPQKSSTKKSAQSKSTNLDSEVVLENRLQRIEQLYNEIPPVKSRISLSEEDFSKIRDSFRDSMRIVTAVTASFKGLIGQSASLRCKELAHSSCQTETVVNDDSTALVTEDKSDVDADLTLCRLCGGFFKKDSVVFLFGKLSKKKKLLLMLDLIVPHIPPIKEYDSLPQHVCEACVEKLTLCHGIINQFLQADKELRQVLQDEKPCTSDASHLEENRVAPSRKISSEEINAISTNKANLESRAFEDHSGGNEVPSKGCSKNNERSTCVQPQGEKRTRVLAGFESSNAEKSTSRHKPKRTRSTSPNRSRSLQTTKSPAPSKASSGCIDLSRLDPEFNDGFEVEWCLDEETIRSSMLSGENVGSGLNEGSPAATVHASAEGTGDAGRVLSADPAIHKRIDCPSGQTASPQKKAKSDLGNETPKLIDEVSKLSEMHTSVCESPVKSGTKQSLSAVRQEKCDIQLNVLTQSPETIKCSSCPLSFHSKQEAFLHKVMQHEEDQADDPKMIGGTQDSGSAVNPKNTSQKQTYSPDSKKEKESSEESIMCDQCGLPFPNEYSLHLHECVIHETTMNSQLVIKDSKGLEYKIINSKETLEREACKEVPEAPLTDGKILVKCGSGMLWVNCSKFFTEEQMANIQSSELSGISYADVENGTVSMASDQSVSNLQNIPKVQFAYKCDHCKKIFTGRSDLLTHMQTHMRNYSTEEYNCSECGTRFRTMKALNNHIPSHIPLDRVCEECGLILLDSKKLVQHRKEHTHNLPHMCESCGKRFPNEQTLEVHETVHYSKKGPLACSLCRKCFFFKHSLVRHRSQHASNRLQKCSLCFRVLNSSDQLRKHVALHHLMKNFVCFCKQTFPSQKELVEHRYLKHSYAEIFCARNKVEIVEPLPLHQCSVCLRVLNSKQSLLKHHVTSHSSTWPFYCIQCSRKYTSMYYLARHECHRKNTSAFQCRICGKAFQNKNVFKQHKVIHNNRKWRYICRHCGKAFQKSQSLVTHIMTHGGKKFSCPRCHQSCQDKEGLLKHYNNGSCQMKGKSLQ